MIKLVGRIPEKLENAIISGQAWEIDVKLFGNYGDYLHGIKSHAAASPRSYSRSSRRSILDCAKSSLKSILEEGYPELKQQPKLMDQAFKMLSFSIRKPTYWDGDPKEDRDSTCYQPVTVSRKKTLLAKSLPTVIDLADLSFSGVPSQLET